MQKVVVKNVDNQLVISSEVEGIELDGCKKTLVKRFVFKIGLQTKVQDIFQNGFLVWKNDNWHYHQQISDAFLFYPIKKVFTKIISVAENEQYQVFLPDNYQDLPDIYAMELLSPLNSKPVQKNRLPKRKKFECWFCMSSSGFDTSLVTHVLNSVYITAAKGPISESHGLIVPIEHMELFKLNTNFVDELKNVFIKINNCLEIMNYQTIFWIAKKKLTSDRMHDFISFVGLDRDLQKKLPKKTFCNFTFDFERGSTIPFVIENSEILTIQNPRYLDLLTHLFSSAGNWRERIDDQKQLCCNQFISSLRI
eukprot:NODE_126_length_17250_cov_2.558743.p8 type:complete len:309 gc:universal NODE_126_length_17250_cov_2.558743:15128-14202(-)